MKMTYTLPVMAKCPVDGADIEYQVMVKADIPFGDPPLMVERLKEIAAAAVAEPILQENLTERLWSKLIPHLQNKLEVITVGTHSGVTITCVV